MSSILLTIPSYEEPDLPYTLESAIRMSSGLHTLHISVVEQVTQYVEAYTAGRTLPAHVELDYEMFDKTLIGAGGARYRAELFYDDEEYQVQIDAHARFDPDWDARLLRHLSRLDTGILTGLGYSTTWMNKRKIPRVVFDHFQDGIPAGHTELDTPPSGSLSDVFPARTVMCGALAGRAWCVDVPADPYMIFGGEEPALAARLWTHGRDLWHGSMPWVEPYVGENDPAGKHWEHPEWPERNAITMRRMKSLLTGKPLENGDEAGIDMHLFGLGMVRSLAAWLAYAGLDYEAETVVNPWPLPS